MKKTGYTIVAAIGIIIAVAAIGFGIFSFEKTGMSTGESVSDVYNLDSSVFNTLEIFGVWEATIEIDSTLDQPELKLQLPKDQNRTEILFQVTDTVARLENKRSIGNSAKIKIRTPKLNKLEAAILGDLSLKGDSPEGLDLVVNGTGTLSAEGTNRGILNLTGSWTGELDLSGLKSDSANVDLDLTGELNILVEENIQGQIRGLGSVKVLGNPSGNTLQTKGLFGD